MFNNVHQNIAISVSTLINQPQHLQNSTKYNKIYFEQRMDLQNVILIILASALMFGYCFGFDLPQALEAPLRQQPYNYDNLEFNFLYFFQFLPVVLFQIPIGFLIDKYPLKRTLFFFCFLSLGAMLVSGLVFEFMAPGYKWIINMLRASFGVCGQALFTVQAVLLTYFAKEHYEVSMGICLCLPFVCDALNSIITTHVYDATHYMALTWYIAAGFCFVSLICGFVINKRYLAEMQQIQKDDASQKQIMASQSTVEVSEKLLKVQEEEEKENEDFNCKSITKLNSQFWVLCGAVFFFEAALGPYFDNMNDMIVKRFGISYTDAGKMIILPQALLVVFGYILQKICATNPHWRRKIMLGSSILYFIFISWIYLLPNTTEPTAIYYIVICVFLLLMSLMFACEYCALLGSTSYFVHKSELGTAYAIGAVSLGLSQCLGPLVNSAILNQYTVLEKSYELLSLFGAGLAIFPVIFAIWMYEKEFEILDYNLKDDFAQKKLKDEM